MYFPSDPGVALATSGATRRNPGVPSGSVTSDLVTSFADANISAMERRQIKDRAKQSVRIPNFIFARIVQLHVRPTFVILSWLADYEGVFEITIIARGVFTTVACRFHVIPHVAGTRKSVFGPFLGIAELPLAFAIERVNGR